jgi:hypothetical protein
MIDLPARTEADSFRTELRSARMSCRSAFAMPGEMGVL